MLKNLERFYQTSLNIKYNLYLIIVNIPLI